MPEQYQFRPIEAPEQPFEFQHIGQPVPAKSSGSPSVDFVAEWSTAVSLIALAMLLAVVVVVERRRIFARAENAAVAIVAAAIKSKRFVSGKRSKIMTRAKERAGDAK